MADGRDLCLNCSCVHDLVHWHRPAFTGRLRSLKVSVELIEGSEMLQCYSVEDHHLWGGVEELVGHLGQRHLKPSQITLHS